MKNPTSIERLADWRIAQGHSFPDQMEAHVSLGPIYSDSWLRDPKHLVFALSRYKFVSKMLSGSGDVAEVGAGDGWANSIVEREVSSLDCYDLSPLRDGIRRYDVMEAALPQTYEAIYALDVFEHVKSGEAFFRNLTASLRDHGKLIVGAPSLEGQTYASEPSRKLHINCMTGEALRALALRFFRHVFMFSMNDETVHTGFMPLAHYLFAVCAEPIR
jgi:Methyltransferase domain